MAAGKERKYLVSVHGGHSGQYCCHAQDTLDEVVQAYARYGFNWVVISEHIPPQTDAFLYPDEIEAGLDSKAMYQRFAAYLDHCRRLQRQFLDMKILVAMETETCGNYLSWITRLRSEFCPDLVVGAVHHVDDIAFDYGPEQYRQAVDKCGGLEKLYCRYFDLQHAMIEGLKPQVVAHFDLIRIFDPGYSKTISAEPVRRRWLRNLELVADLGLVLDYNVSSLRKGAAEPYPTMPICRRARELGIIMAPGDDSHSVATVGVGIKRGIKLLEKAGFGDSWKNPPLIDEVIENRGPGQPVITGSERKFL